MTSQFYIGQKGTYSIGKEIGRGGEGSVYEISNNPSLVLKLYTEKPDKAKLEKLRLMASLTNPQIDKYTAWVKDVVIDNFGNAGFTMRKLENYFPLHKLFSPMDRKKLFPDKGYNFLVHVARNLAIAFNACHEAGVVIGDVNEGNIQVNNQGMISFIDCDSFQLKQGNSYFFCEVGVPRYTPPELLEKTTFSNVIRTINTDSFSLAILIFQILFLGRHPFAGKNNSNEDIDEETAIKKHFFAYSLKKNAKRLYPPDDSFDINALNVNLSDLFHYAFEKIELRPQPIEWAKELTFYLNDLVVCKNSKLHFYPKKLSFCPWCNFKDTRNILYFLDDVSVDQKSFTGDIEKFINGFKIENISFRELGLPSLNTTTVYPQFDDKYKNYKKYNQIVAFIPIVVSLFLIPLSGWYIAVGILISLILNETLPWKKSLQIELSKRKNQYTEIKEKLSDAIKQYNEPIELKNYQNIARQIEDSIFNYKKIPTELQARKKSVEEKLYADQLHTFLSNFEIRQYEIPSFGATRKLALYTAGIRTASDIDKLRRLKVQGIGPAYEQKLYYWQTQVASKFVYHPNNDLLQQHYNIITAEVNLTKQKLESTIRLQYEALSFSKANLNNRQVQLSKYIEQGAKSYLNANAEYESLKRYV